jgi:hypothetical protein
MAKKHRPQRTQEPRRGVDRLPGFLEVAPYRFVPLDEATPDQLRTEAARMERDQGELADALLAMATKVENGGRFL